MGHGHSHGHAGGRHRWRLAVAFGLVAVFFGVELVVGLVSGSLALISDAGHMAADVVALGAALVATKIATRPDGTGRRTYGSYRAEVFASVFTVLVMLGVSAYVVVEAVRRVGEDVAVPRSRLVDYVAALEAMAADNQVHLKVVAHAGDGNLHPTFWIERTGGRAGIEAMERLQQVLDKSITAALEMGGTITGEHGVGQYKLRWLGQEQPEPLRELQRRIKQLFDPAGILNPGKAI